MDTESQRSQQDKQRELIERARLDKHQRVIGGYAPTASRMVYFLGYPRSGNTWFKWRERRISACRQISAEKRKRLIKHTHFGYNPMSEFCAGIQGDFRGVMVVVLLREHKSVLASHFNLFNKKSTDINRHLAPSDPVEFALGCFGAQRLCCFLGDVQEKIQDRADVADLDVSYIHYDDMFDACFVDILADILKLESPLTEMERESLVTAFDKTEQSKKWALTFDAETAARIDAYVDEHCKLDAYRRRYLER